MQLQQTPPYSHQRNGSVEKMNDLVQKEARTMRFDLEQRRGVLLHPGMAAWAWLVRHSAWRIARYQLKGTGRTPFEDALDTEFKSEIAPFGESVMARRNVSDSGAIQGQGGARLYKADSPGSVRFGLAGPTAPTSTSLRTRRACSRRRQCGGCRLTRRWRRR